MADFARKAFGVDLKKDRNAMDRLNRALKEGRPVALKYEDGKLYLGVGNTVETKKEYLVRDVDVTEEKTRRERPTMIYLERTPWNNQPGWVMWQGTMTGNKMEGTFWQVDSEGRIIGLPWRGSFLVDDLSPQEALRKAQDREHPVALGVFKPQGEFVMEKTGLSGGAGMDSMTATQAVLTMSKGFKSEDPGQRTDAEQLAQIYFHGEDYVRQGFARQYAHELNILAQKHKVELGAALRGFAEGKVGFKIPFTNNSVAAGVQAELQKQAKDATSVDMIQAATLTILNLAAEGKISDQEAAENLRALRQWAIDLGTRTTAPTEDGKPRVTRGVDRVTDSLIQSGYDTGGPGFQSTRDNLHDLKEEAKELLKGAADGVSDGAHDALKGSEDAAKDVLNFDLKR